MKNHCYQWALPCALITSPFTSAANLFASFSPVLCARSAPLRAAVPILSALGLLAMATVALAGPYAPAVGQPGSTAIHYTSPDYLFWANGHSAFLQGPDGESFDVPSEAYGAPTGDTPDDVFDVVSLGQGGQIILTFPQPIADGDGPDFAVFENAFTDNFLELAYVEVSNDGVNFVRFPNTSLTAGPVPSYGAVDPTNVDGLAGKYRVGNGTPFNLGDVGLDYVTHIRLLDVVGDGNSLDSQSNPIYDPYPTEGSAGLDVDAVGALNDTNTFSAWQAAQFDAAELADPLYCGPEADPDFDGLHNLVEYALNLNPEAADDSSDVIQADITGANLVIKFSRYALKTDITYHIEFSTDLHTWEEVARSVGGAATTAFGAPGASSIVETASPNEVLVEIGDSLAIGAVDGRFGRIRVTTD